MRIRIIFLVIFWLVTATAYSQITVHESGKYLVETKSGKPFFWLGDTAWELFHRLTREEAITYLDTRQAQGFNLIQIVALAEMDGLRVPNRHGDVPFVALNPLDWAVTAGNDPHNEEEYDYWDHVDFIIKEAAKRNLYVGLLPTWGDKVARLWGAGPQVFNESNAYGYSKKLAERYEGQWNVLWILGGDRPPAYDRKGKFHDDRAIWRAMARGIEDVWGKSAFITYHPGGTMRSSSAWFHDEDWLDMNAIQSGHGGRQYEIWDTIRNDIALHPRKPTMDMEPCYEDHGVNPWDGKWTAEGRGYFEAYDVRARMYRGVFAGGCGTTYGHHHIWQFADSALYEPVHVAGRYGHWRDALQADGANHIRYLKDVVMDRRDMDRTVDQDLVVSNRGTDYRDLVIATRNTARTWAMVYLPNPEPITIDLSRLGAKSKKVSWFNPVTGKYTTSAKRYRGSQGTFVPPNTDQRDWVLVIETKGP